MTGQPNACSPEELGSLFLFEKLDRGQLSRLCREGRVKAFEPGRVFAEGEPAAFFYVLLEGTVVLSRRVGADDVEIVRTSQRGVYAGAFQAYLGDRVRQAYTSSLRATEPTRFFVLPADAFASVMREWFPMAVHLLEGLLLVIQSAQQTVGQRERLLALGSLSAGVTHELNNPAAAVARAAKALRERVAGMRHTLGVIAAGPGRRDTVKTLVEIQERIAGGVSEATVLSPLEAADREDALAGWLEDHGIADGWELAPIFVQGGLDTEWLDRVAAAVDEPTLAGAVRWLTYTIETELLLNEVGDSAARISQLVDAVKQYSQLDRAPYQRADIHELLDSTLLMLSGKVGPNIEVVKDYGQSLPRIPAHPSQLNQVWTNLIDNAVYAMNSAGGKDLDCADQARARTHPRRNLRHGPRGVARDPRPDLRSVFHDQVSGRRDRPRFGHLLAHRREQAPR
jgi:signal transduction histidine kinase